MPQRRSHRRRALAGAIWRAVAPRRARPAERCRCPDRHRDDEWRGSHSFAHTRERNPVNEDRATRYHRLKRRALVLSLGWSGLLLFILLVTGVSVQLRVAAQRLAAAIGDGGPATVVLFYVAGLMLLHETGSVVL